MAVGPHHAPARRFRGVAVAVAVLALIWAGLPLLPEGSGLRFGWVYQVFVTAMAALAALFFRFLGRGPIGKPERPSAVVASVAAVFLATVGLLVLVGVVYPQFPVPQKSKAAGQQNEAAARGREFFLSPSVGCFRCHKIAGKGGIRGPDLTAIASRAATRLPGKSARDYLLEKIAAGSAYEYRVPKYAPMMPPFKLLISKAQVEDIVAYLLTLKPASNAREEDGETGD